MIQSFDEKLDLLFKQFGRRETGKVIWQQASKQVNYKLCIAEDLLNVKWCDDLVDETFSNSKNKTSLITKLRISIAEMVNHGTKSDNHGDLYCEQYGSYCSAIMKHFQNVKTLFGFTKTMKAYKLLFDCLQPNEMEFIEELFHTRIKYHKLLQIASLYAAFKLNLSLSQITNHHTPVTKGSLSEQVLELLNGFIKPDNISGFELKNNEGLPFIRVKFGQEDQVTSSNPDFLKIVAIMRLAHSSLIDNMKPSLENASKINKFVTYGLLTDKNFVRILGMRVIFILEEYTYQLYHVGDFPIEPKTDEEELLFDSLISFLLEACRQTIQEENGVINAITKFSRENNRMTSRFSISDLSDFAVGDRLVITDSKRCLKTTIILTEYCLNLSNLQEGKNIYKGIIGTSLQPVYVKMCFGMKQLPIIGNIFIPITLVHKNGILCKEIHFEISLAGTELSIYQKRNADEKLKIIEQLLLEMEKIHSMNFIHNDVKPNNIILIKKDDSEFYCKFIDFELAQYFTSENGDISFKIELGLTSTEGTENYNAPEKQSSGDSFIHPKTDIYSLGLVFIELVLGEGIGPQKMASSVYWDYLEMKCEIELKNGKLIFEMIQKMVRRERRERITASECLKILQIVEKVDDTNYTNIFFPQKSIIQTLDNIEESIEEVYCNDTLERCCKCLSCKSPNCTEKRKNESNSTGNKRKKLTSE